jgi:hypothetical protein
VQSSEKLAQSVVVDLTRHEAMREHREAEETFL